MDRPRIETCATHGLRYDASQYNNCVLCRRLVEHPEHEQRSGNKRWLLTGLALAVLGTTTFYFVRRGALPADIPKAAVSCVQPQVDSALACVSACGQADVDCRSDCLNPLNDHLTDCGTLPKLEPSDMQFLAANGKSPEWSSLRERMRLAVNTLSVCDDNRGTFVTNIVVREDKRVAEVAVGSHRRDVAECIAAQLARFDSPSRQGDGYSFLVRVQPPPVSKPVAPPAPPPTAASPRPLPVPPRQQGAVLSSKLGDADLIQVQDALGAARGACFPTQTPQCAPAVSKLRPHFATLAPSTTFSQGRRMRFAPNAIGAEFDCVNIETKQRFMHNTAVAVTQPKELPSARWALVSSSPLDAFANPEVQDVSPKTAPTHFLHLNALKAEELSLCVSVPGGDRSEWQVGVATYDRPMGAAEYNWHETDRAAFGFVGPASLKQQLGAAIINNDYRAVQSMLDRGASANSVPGALALAFRERWPLDKIGILIDGGADPNSLDGVGESGMHRAALFVPDDEFPDMLKRLVRAGGNVNLLTSDGTPLHVAARWSGRKQKWNALVAAGADPKRTDHQDRTPEQVIGKGSE